LPSLAEGSTSRGWIAGGRNLSDGLATDGIRGGGAALAGLLARLGIGDEVLREPVRLDPFDRWLGHAPFGFWLLRALRPRVLVEWSGASCVSWFGWCQGIEADRLGTEAVAVGGWAASSPGLYRVSDVDRWFEAHGALYGGFGALPRVSVTAGREPFAAASIDLLVIREWPAEGLAEFERWREALSPRAVVVVQPGDGLRPAGSSFRFVHAGGLHVVGVGGEQAAGVSALLGLAGAEADLARRLFAARGGACEARGELAAERERGRAQATGFEAQVQALRRQQRAELETAARDVTGWVERALHSYDRWRLRREEELRGEVEGLKGALARAEVEREGAREAVRSVMASTSWRVTRPLRMAGGLRGRAPEVAEVPAPVALPAVEVAVEVRRPEVGPVRDGRVALPDLFVLRDHVARSPVAVVLQIGAAAEAEAALGWLGAIGAGFDLFVTLVEDRSDHLLPMLRERLPGAPMFAFAAEVSDGAAVLALAGSGALFGYGLVCRLVAGGEAAPAVLGDVAGVLAGFAGDADLGMVADGEAFWVRPWVLRDLVGWDGEGLAGAVADACAAAGLAVRGGAEALVALRDAGGVPRVVAFYLPQFHPIAENDAWWGKGFTEWRNVTAAEPLFAGHRQPRLPGELGFTDLRVGETREAQAALARAYGVSAFCYYHYWFGAGRRLLQRPLDEVLASGRPDFPFMICWANEPWSRRWDGGREDVLVAQDYAEGWEEAFADEIAPLLRDGRYVRMADGRPMVLIYRIMHLPSPAPSLARIRRRLEAMGVGAVHIGAGWFSLVGDEPLPDDPADVGCDSYFEFPPHRLPTVMSETALAAFATGQVFDYPGTVDRAVASLPGADRRVHRGVMMGWDNTARRGSAAHVYEGATPCQFRRWLREVVVHEQASGLAEEKLVFVNAWNEWAEGTCLEPDQNFGRGWLEAVRSALGRE